MRLESILFWFWFSSLFVIFGSIIWWCRRYIRQYEQIQSMKLETYENETDIKTLDREIKKMDEKTKILLRDSIVSNIAVELELLKDFSSSSKIDLPAELKNFKITMNPEVYLHLQDGSIQPRARYIKTRLKKQTKDKLSRSIEGGLLN